MRPLALAVLAFLLIATAAAAEPKPSAQAAHGKAILAELAAAGDLMRYVDTVERRLAEFAKTTPCGDAPGDCQVPLGAKPLGPKPLPARAAIQTQRAAAGRALADVEVLQKRLAVVGRAFDRADAFLGRTGGGDSALADNAAAVDRVRAGLKDAIKDLEARDKLDCFELQDTISALNQAQVLASGVLKELSMVRSDTIRRIGG